MQHLGGHLNITHTDEGVLNLLKNKFNMNSILDVGCGPGGQLSLASKIGFKHTTGIDGDPSIINNNIIVHDFTKKPFYFANNFDLGWSCEFVEHVKEEFIPNFMECFKRCKIIALTHATPNTPGHHHVNCRTSSYWKNIFSKNNFEFREKLTLECRLSSTMKRDFFRQNGLVFTNKKLYK